MTNAIEDGKKNTPPLLVMAEKYTSSAGHFDGTQYGRSRATLDAIGCQHWALGKYSSRIIPADAMVIDFDIKKLSCCVVKLLSGASVQKAQNEPSTQLIEATSCVERTDATIKAKELCNFSSYQTLIMDKNW